MLSNQFIKSFKPQHTITRLLSTTPNTHVSNTSNMDTIQSTQSQQNTTQQQRIKLQQQITLLENLSHLEQQQQQYETKQKNKLLYGVVLVFTSLFSLISTYRLWTQKVQHDSELHMLQQQLLQLNTNNTTQSNNNDLASNYINVTNDIINHYMNSAREKHDIELIHALNTIKNNINQ